MLTEFSQVESYGQIATFGWAILLGISLCCLYDCYRTIILQLGCPKFFANASDVVFFIFGAIVCFCFLLVECKGQIRLYAIGGFALGFYLLRKYLSKLIRKWVGKILNVITKVFSFVFAPVYRCTFFCYNKMVSLIEKLPKTFALFSKKKEKPLANDSEYDV